MEKDANVDFELPCLASNIKKKVVRVFDFFSFSKKHSYDILGARMLWKPKEARILKNFIDQPV
jgi:hypothetical protein